MSALPCDAGAAGAWDVNGNRIDKTRMRVAYTHNYRYVYIYIQMQCDIVCTRVRLSDTIKLETGFTAGKTTRRKTEAFHRKKKKVYKRMPLV